MTAARIMGTDQAGAMRDKRDYVLELAAELGCYQTEEDGGVIGTWNCWRDKDSNALHGTLDDKPQANDLAKLALNALRSQSSENEAIKVRYENGLNVINATEQENRILLSEGKRMFEAGFEAGHLWNRPVGQLMLYKADIEHRDKCYENLVSEGRAQMRIRSGNG